MTHQKNRGIRFYYILIFISFVMISAGCGSKEKPPDAEYFHKTGMTLFQEGLYGLLPKGKMDEANRKLEQAEKAFQQAVALDPDAIESHRYLARVYTLRKNYSAAISEFLIAIELDPEDFDTYMVLSSVYVRMKRYDEAQKVLEHAKTKSKDPAAVELINRLIKDIKAKELG